MNNITKINIFLIIVVILSGFYLAKKGAFSSQKQQMGKSSNKLEEYFVAPKPGFVNAIDFCKTAFKGANDNLCSKCAPGPNFDGFKEIIGDKLSNVDFGKILNSIKIVDFGKILNSIKMEKKQRSAINKQLKQLKEKNEKQRMAIIERLKEKNEKQRMAIIERLKEKFVRPLQTELMNNFNAIEQDIYGSQMDWWKTGKNIKLCSKIIRKRNESLHPERKKNKTKTKKNKN